MKTASSLLQLHENYGFTNVFAACGVFDGVHKGHQRLIEQLLSMARRYDAEPVIVTFDPHPRAVLFPDQAPQLLTVKEQKLRLFDNMGVTATVLLPFDRDLAALPPLPFLEQYLIHDEVKLSGVCVGSNWHFGASGRGDTEFLSKQGAEHGFIVLSVPELQLYGKPVSSTRIREAIQQGRLTLARRLLGRRYSVYGHVSHGKGLGASTFHCPTANLLDEQILLPPDGVYAVRCLLIQGGHRTAMNGIVYVGTAPTLAPAGKGTPRSTLECHLFDFNSDLYGRSMEVEFLQFIRPDICFHNTVQLSQQIQQDLKVARDILAR